LASNLGEVHLLNEHISILGAIGIGNTEMQNMSNGFIIPKIYQEVDRK
jgi:hypothetical protein